MRKITVEKTLYTYPELSDDAKEKVRQWWNRLEWEDGVAQESMTDLWESTLHVAGWSDLSDLTYDLYQQGGYPRWTGTLAGFEHGGRKWTVRTESGHRYNRSVWVEYEGEEDVEPQSEEFEAAEEAAKEMVSALSSELFWKFREEDDYIGSDEQVAEACEANGYEFTEDGELA